MKLMKRFKKNEKGFTLIELIVVIAIIAILAALIVPRFMNVGKGADSAVVTQNAKTLSKMISMYQAGTGNLPQADVLKYTGSGTGATETKELIFKDSKYGSLSIVGVTEVKGAAAAISGNSNSVFTSGALQYKVTVESKSYSIEIDANGKVTVN